MTKLFIAGLLALTLGPLAIAQPTVKNFSRLENKDIKGTYISKGELNYRVGNTVWAHLLFDGSEEFKIANAVLIACNGKWVSSPIKGVFQSGVTMLQAYETLQTKLDELPTEYVSYSGGDLITEGIAQALKLQAKSLCATAKKSIPKGRLLGISANSGSESSAELTSILLDSGRVDSKGRITAWIRVSTYQKPLDMNQDGSERRSVRVSDFDNQPYDLQQWMYDCKEQTSGILQVAKYGPDGRLVDKANPDKKSALEEPVPGSIGDYELNWACRLYNKD